MNSLLHSTDLPITNDCVKSINLTDLKRNAALGFFLEERILYDCFIVGVFVDGIRVKRL